MSNESYESERQAVEQIKGARDRIGAELSKVIVGQQETIEHLLISVLSGGHCLLTGLRVWPRRCWSSPWRSCSI